MDLVQPVLLGAVSMGLLVAAIFFVRFWMRTRDAFFLFFAIAFFIESISRVVLAFERMPNENDPLFYLPRLAAYSLIALAVIFKNRPHKR